MLLKTNRLELSSGPFKRKELPTWDKEGRTIFPENTSKPMTFSLSSGMSSRRNVLPDAGNQPDATQEHIDYYKRNKEKIVPPIVKGTLRKHPEDVLHGSRSLDMIIPNYPRKPSDWDTFSPEEKRRALAYEKAIDEKVGADIAETHYIKIPKVSMGPDDPAMGKHLYRVVTPRISNDAEIDIMNRPSDLETERYNGITHESLASQYRKAVTRKGRQPTKAQKALSDQRAIEAYWESKGKTPPTVESSSIGSFGRNSGFRMRKSIRLNVDARIGIE